MKKKIKPTKLKGDENLDKYLEEQKQRIEIIKKVIKKLKKNT